MCARRFPHIGYPVPRMTVSIDLLSIRVSFLPFPGEAGTEEWTFTHEPCSSEPESWPVDEHQVEADLCAAFADSGGTDTLTFCRRVSWGGWGATGPTVLDIAISVSAGVASNVLWASIVRLYRKYAGKDPKAARVSRPRANQDTLPAVYEPRRKGMLTALPTPTISKAPSLPAEKRQKRTARGAAKEPKKRTVKVRRH
jgi:hypothetical protein